MPLHADRASSPSWLPDMCRGGRVLVMLGLAELVAVVVALAPESGRDAGWGGFISASAFASWLALSVSAALCLLRRRADALPRALSGVLALLVAGGIVVLASSVVYALLDAADQAPTGVGFWRFVLGSAATGMLMTALALRYFYVSDRWEAQVKAHARAEADALQARIRPHFLFNSMNLIASLVRRDAALAEQAVLDLSDLFRAALGAGEGTSTLREEVELTRRYLSIESLRLGERLAIDWQLDEPLPWTMPMPRLILQPLVENAVLHGISRLPEGGCVRIGIASSGQALGIRIENPAPEPRAAAGPQAGAGHAQQNIASRLGYAFGAKAHLVCGWEAGAYRCAISVPAQQ